MCRKVIYLVSVVVLVLSVITNAQVIEPVADAYVRGGSYADTNYGTAGSLTLKNAGGDYNRKVYFRFEVSGPVSEASIDLTVATNNEGGGGTTPQTFTVEVYGLAESLDHTWAEEDITWTNAPANDLGTHDFTADATKLGSFLVEETPNGDGVSFSDPNLTDFINNDTDSQITLMLRRTAGTSSSHNLVFASKEHASHAPAALTTVVANRASGPNPTHTAVDVPRDVVLGWMPGLFAATHNVYVGTTFEDVNAATVPTAADLDVSSFDPGRLVLGKTYFWRVDDVNAAPDYTVFKGGVWNFTVESVAIPIDTVTVTASGANLGMEPEKTTDGSGLSGLNQHSTSPADMWLTVTDGSWIQYEFNAAYKLHQMQVWNSNQAVEPFIGFGVKDALVETSLDGVTWTALNDVPPFGQGTGLVSYEANTTVTFGGAVAKYVKISPQSTFGSMGQGGLSEVRFSRIPTEPRDMRPANGSTSASVDVSLAWRAGREANVHEVSLGTDPADLGLAGTVDDPTFVAGGLDYDQTYYWQIVEVNEAQVPARYASDVQSFNTASYMIVDDFESYSGDEGEEVFMTWWDGFGGDAGLGGSTTGHIDAPFVETALFYDGGRSMPLYVDNDGGFFDIDGRSSSPTFSEVTREFSPAQDWRVSGLKTLSIMFAGSAGLSGQLYCKINGTKLLYDGEASNIGSSSWQAWNIDLSGVAGNMDRVSELAIGVDGGSSGILYIDAIRLYPGSGDIITPVQPDTANLVAHYAFDGSANDSAGGLHGTLVGAPTFVPGQQGQAISLNTNTVTDYVEMTGYQGILGANPVTVTAWIKTTTDATGAIIGWGPNTAGQRFGFRIDAGRLRTEHHGGNIQGDGPVNDGQWHHVAVTVQANSTVSYPEVQLWLDGLDNTRPTTDPDAYNITADLDVCIGRRPAADDRYFIGEIDDLRIYDRALTAAEIAALAGKTQAIHVPF